MLPLIALQRIDDARGVLVVAEKMPFAVARAYWIFGVQAGAKRGGHAHRTLHRWMVAVAGSFLLRVDDGPMRIMSDPAQAAYIAQMQWVDLSDFSRDAVCLVLASAEYDARDYIRSKEQWLRIRQR